MQCRFETEDEAKLAYDQAVRALKLEKSLNYPASSCKYFSPDVARKVQAFMAKNIMEPSNSCSSTPGGDDQHTDLNESPTTSGNSTASGGLGNCGSAQVQHHLHSYADAEYMYMHPDHEYMHHADMHTMDQAAVQALAASAAAAAADMCGHHQHMECMPDMMQLGQQPMGGGYCDGGSGCATDMLLPGQQQGYAACTWQEAALQMQGGPSASSYEAQQQGMMAGCCDMTQQLACGGAHYMEEAPAMQELEQQHTDMCQQQQQEHAQLQTDQQQQGEQVPGQGQGQGQGKTTDDVRVMLALLAEILAEDEMHGPADLLDDCHAAEVSHAQLQEQHQQQEDFLQVHQEQEQEAFLPTHQEEQEHQGYQMQTHQEQPQGCGTGYLAAPACAFLQASPAGSPSTPVLQDSSSDTLGYHAAASMPRQQQPQPQQQQLNCHVKQQQQQWMPAASANGGRTAPEPQQAQAQLPCLVSYGEVVLFVDVTTKLMLQLYTQLTANSMQHAGLTAIQWMADVRINLGAPSPTTPGSSPSPSAGVGGTGAAGLPAAVHAAVLHTCSSLVSVGAGSGPDMVASLSGGGSFSSCFLVTVLEQVMKALMSLRSMCSVCCPTQAMCPSVVTAMQGQLQAQSDTHEGQAVIALLGWLLGYV